MTPIKKILTFFISFLVLGFFLLVSFFLNFDKQFEKILFEDNKISVLDLKKNKFLDKTNFKIKENNWKIIKENINLLDNLYSKNNSSFYKIKENQVKISSGLYLFDFKKLWKNYEIVWKNFIINTLGLWKIYINNTNPEAIIIYNFDNVLDLYFLNNKKEKVNKIKLFPHNLLVFSKFQINQNSFKWWDFARMKDFLIYKYINNSYLEKKWEKLIISEKFFLEFEKNILRSSNIKRLVKKETNFLKMQKNFLTEIFNDFLKQEEKNSEILNKLKNTKVWNLKINSFLEKYSFLSLNTKKRNIYKQNIIFEKIHNLFLNVANPTNQGKNKIKNWKIDIEKLKIDIKNFKKIDEKKYLELKNIVKYYYIILWKNNYIEEMNSKNDFYELYKTLSSKFEEVVKNEKNNNLEEKNIYYKDFEKLNSIYHSYDFKKFSTKEKNILWKNILINNFYNFSKTFILKIKEFEKDEKNREEILNYYSIFLYNFIKNNLNFENDNIVWYTKLLETYNSIKMKKVTPSKVLENINLLEEIDKTIRSTFFEKNRDKNKKLLLKKIKLVPKEKRENLYYIINIIKKFIKENLYLLEEKDKDKIYFSKLEEIEKNIYEYDKALSNFLAYSWVESSDLDYSIINNIKKDNNLSINKIKKYLKTFKDIEFGKTTTIKVEENYYNIKNLILKDRTKKEIEMKKISFKLYPKENNTIDDIVINEKNISVSFPLDEIKELWKKKFKNSSNKNNKNNFNFKYFFVNTFTKKENNKIITENKSDIYEESSKIIKLKRERLLWEERWELSSLKNIMKVNYENIFVNEDDQWGFDVKLKNIAFFIKIKENKNSRTKTGLLSANYLLDNIETYFSNMKITFTDNKKSLLDSTQIKVVWTIKYFSIEENLTKIMNDSEQISFIYNNVKSILKPKNIDINYYIKTGTIIYTAKYKENWNDVKLNIKTKKWKIISIERNMENILWWDIIDYKELKYSLNSL